MRTFLLLLLLFPAAVLAEQTTFVATAYNSGNLESDFSAEVVEELSPCGSVTLNWQAPTENTDGTPLTDLAGFRIYAHGPGEVTFQQVADINSPGVTSFVVTAPCVEVLPPSGLVVSDSNLFVFMLNQTKNNPVLEPVGTVPAGTPCNGTKSIQGTYYVVDVDLVDWAGSVRPQVVWAQCQPGL